MHQKELKYLHEQQLFEMMQSKGISMSANYTNQTV
jgi:hypothetical protein